MNLGNYLDNLDLNNVGSQGMILVMKRQLPLIRLYVSNYYFYPGDNNITSEGLRLISDFNFFQLK
jgi:hypothetical protein